MDLCIDYIVVEICDIWWKIWYIELCKWMVGVMVNNYELKFVEELGSKFVGFMLVVSC